MPSIAVSPSSPSPARTTRNWSAVSAPTTSSPAPPDLATAVRAVVPGGADAAVDAVVLGVGTQDGVRNGGQLAYLIGALTRLDRRPSHPVATRRRDPFSPACPYGRSNLVGSFP
ncbi:MAG: hypothetical protein ACRDP9_23895 [Kribbellaceae bacterium]